MEEEEREILLFFPSFFHFLAGVSLLCLCVSSDIVHTIAAREDRQTKERKEEEGGGKGITDDGPVCSSLVTDPTCAHRCFHHQQQ